MIGNDAPLLNPESSLGRILVVLALALVALVLAIVLGSRWSHARRRLNWPSPTCVVVSAEVRTGPVLRCFGPGNSHVDVRLDRVTDTSRSDLRRAWLRAYPVGKKVQFGDAVCIQASRLSPIPRCIEWAYYDWAERQQLITLALWFLLLFVWLVALLVRENQVTPAVAALKGLAIDSFEEKRPLHQPPPGFRVSRLLAPPKVASYRSDRHPLLRQAHVVYRPNYVSKYTLAILVWALAGTGLLAFVTNIGRFHFSYLVGICILPAGRVMFVRYLYRCVFALNTHELRFRQSAVFSLFSKRYPRRSIQTVRVCVSSAQSSDFDLLLILAPNKKANTLYEKEAVLLAGAGRSVCIWMGRMIALWAACPFVFTAPDGEPAKDRQ